MEKIIVIVKEKVKFFKIIGRLKKSENRGCSDNYDL